MTPIGKSADKRFEEAFAEAFIKKAASPKVDDKSSVGGKQEGADPGEDGGTESDWEGTDPEQYSPQVKARAKDTRDGELGRMFANTPSPRGAERAVKMAHVYSPTVQERVVRLLDRR